MAITFSAPTGSGARVRVQKFGTFLSNMIMPNIPALIAWGLLTALVIVGIVTVVSYLLRHRKTSTLQ